MCVQIMGQIIGLTVAYIYAHHAGHAYVYILQFTSSCHSPVKKKGTITPQLHLSLNYESMLMVDYSFFAEKISFLITNRFICLQSLVLVTTF